MEELLERLENIELYLSKIYRILLKYEREDSRLEIENIAKELKQYEDRE
ncbi:MAG: hypothetical protein IIZ26_00135 [Oscillospiraceae bacterium]|nr:hypothetical protein [Oscillospiraceae bacterium]